MTGDKGKIWFSIVIAFAICLTVYTLSYLVTMPWHTLPGLNGDGIKNDFTYLYHSIYGKGYWFEGMNYPYGEHIVYTDGQPLLSVLLAGFKHVSANEALTVMRWLIGLSYVLSIAFIYKILLYFRVNSPLAVIFAGLIGIFSPQLFRVTGHYALSYTCVVPMLFYWTIKYNELSVLKYCVYIFVFGIIIAFLHPYFAAIVLIWAFLYGAGYFIFTRGQPLTNKIKHIAPMLISIGAVFATIAIVMKITDPVKDRPVSPYGMLTYVTYKSDVVTSMHSPIWQFIKEHHMLRRIFPYLGEGGDREGYTYIGLVVIAALFYSLAIGVVSKIKKNKVRIIVSEDSFSPIWLFMAFAALLFSMGVPYIWHMEWLLDRFSFLRQFRSLGRFSWIFYYIITIYGAVVIHRAYTYFTSAGRVWIGYAMLLSAIGIWSYEASGYTRYTRSIAAQAAKNYDIYFSITEQNWESFLQEHHYNKNDFQAILALNFFHIGSDKLWVGESGMRMTLSGKAAIQLHLPIIDVMMSRSSWSQTKKQVKIAAGPYADKPILNDIKSNKPFLVLRYDHDTVDMDQKYLLEASDYIGHYSVCSIYACYPDRLAANDKKKADSINKILPFMSAADTCVVNKGPWFVRHMDDGNGADHLFGAGASPAISGNDSVIAVFPLKPVKDSQEYEFSCWFLLGEKDYSSPNVYLESIDSAGHTIGSCVMNTNQSVDNYNMWFRGSLYFCISANCRAIRCRLENIPSPSYKVMDEIMLRPSDAVIISKAADGSVMVNNHLFKKAGLTAGR